MKAMVWLGLSTWSMALGGCAAPRRPASPQPIPEQGRITMLYDAFGTATQLQKDWGFATLIEYGGKRILFDTGDNPEIFTHNVRASGIDLTRLDLVVVSHRHGDHIAGLNYLMKVNPNVKIYVPHENFGVFGATLPGTFYPRNESLPAERRYFDGQPPDTLRFGSPWPERNFVRLTSTTEIAPGTYLILLKGSWGVDLDVMELSLAIDTPEGIVLVVGCGHPTIEKIVETAKATIGKPIHLVVGGLHLLPATDAEIDRIAGDLHDRWNVEWIAPAHCTGERAFAVLQQVFGDRYVYAGLGSVLRPGAVVRSTAGGGPASHQALDADDLGSYRRLARESDDSPIRPAALASDDSPVPLP